MALRYAALLALLLAIAAVAWALWPRQAAAPASSAQPAAATTTPMRTITIGGQNIAVDVADTEALRVEGLSGRASLAPRQGMLFVFDTPGSWGIWMKDMHFPLDIIWARADGTVITIARGVSPDTYPQAFYPSTPDALYVVEVNAGAAAGVAEGDKIVL